MHRLSILNNIQNNTVILLLLLVNNCRELVTETRTVAVSWGIRSIATHKKPACPRLHREVYRRMAFKIPLRPPMPFFFAHSLARSLPPSPPPFLPCPHLSFFERILIARADKRTSRESGATDRRLAVAALASNSFQPPPSFLIFLTRHLILISPFNTKLYQL